jgi:transcriptional regulator with XRE-family HTH domain
MTEYEQELIALGQAVRRHRHAKGLTIEALARKAGMSTGHLGWIERGHGNPRWDTLSALVSALDMSLSVLLRPDPGVEAMLARHGERRLTPEELEEHFGHLPPTGRAER